MVAISALTVVPSRQVNAVSTAVTLNKAIRALINVCFTAGPSEALWAGTHISGNTGSSIPTAIFAKCFAHGSIPRIAWLANAVVSSNSIEAQSIFITVVLICDALIMFCTRIVINSDVSSFADAHERTRGVDTHRILTAVMAPFSTLINVFTVGIVLSKSPKTIATAANGPVIQISADGILHAVMPFRTKVITFTDSAAAMRQGNLMRFWTIQSWTA